MDSYFSALAIAPNYIRARYNVSVACPNLGLAKERAEHLLYALLIQEENLRGVSLHARGRKDLNHQSNLKNNMAQVESHQGGNRLDGVVSESVWSTLKMICRDYLGLDQMILNMCDDRDVHGIRGILEKMPTQ